METSMGRALEVEIKETEKTLKQLLHQQQSGRMKERIQVLSGLKTQPVPNALMAAMLIERDYSTVKRWLRIYRHQGIGKLLQLNSGGGKSLSWPPEILDVLEKQLHQPQGFDSYKAIPKWLKPTDGIELLYSTRHGIVHKRLKVRPKVVRPQSHQRHESPAIDFEKKALRLSRIAVLYWCTDESRFGLKTVTRRRLTPRGVKPNGQVQWSFQSYYLYGLVEPLTGENLFLEYSHLNTNGFEAYLQEFS